MEELIRFAKAQLLLQLQAVQILADRNGAAFKPEVLLADAGFAHKDIAAMLGKSQMAVSKAISRAKTARTRGAVETPDIEPAADQTGG